MTEAERDAEVMRLLREANQREDEAILLAGEARSLRILAARIGQERGSDERPQ